MPRKSRKRSKAAKSRRRRTYRGRRRLSSRYRITSKRMPTIFPDQILTKLKTNFIFLDTTSTSTGSITYNFLGNSLADPLGTLSANSQPTGLDQWGAFYNRYYVTASKLSVMLYPLAVNETMQISLVPTMNAIDNTGFTSGLYNPKENSYVKWGEQYLLAGKNGKTTVTNFMTTHKISGGEYSKTNPGASGAITVDNATNPLLLWYWSVNLHNMYTPTTVAVALRGEIQMTQWVCLFNRANLPTSFGPPTDE